MKPIVALAPLLMVVAANAAPPTSQRAATQPVASYPAMQKRLADLVAENAKLRDDNSELQKDLDEAVKQIAKLKPAEVKTSWVRADDMKRRLVEKIHLGMTYDEVKAVLENQTDETREGAMIVREFSGYNDAQTGSGGRILNYSLRYIVRTWFDENGKLVDVRDRVEEGTVGR